MTPSSTYTTLQPTQRTILISFSGITGLLITRLFDNTTNSNRRKFASFGMHITQRIHSTSACEIMTDNRYTKLLPKKLNPRNNTIDMPLNRAKHMLRAIYYDGKTLRALKQHIVDFKRGLISIKIIHENTAYNLLYSYWFYCVALAMRYSTLTPAAQRLNCLPVETKFQKATRIIRIIAEFSEMLSPDIAYIMRFTRLAQSFRIMLVRLSGDGSIAAFLTLSKIEPGMIDDILSPHINTRYCGICDSDSHHNWIPSKDRIFGKLKLKHINHIPRTAAIETNCCRRQLIYCLNP